MPPAALPGVGGAAGVLGGAGDVPEPGAWEEAAAAAAGAAVVSVTLAVVVRATHPLLPRLAPREYYRKADPRSRVISLFFFFRKDKPCTYVVN